MTAAAFKAHPYRHPTIGWLPDLQSMTRDELYGYYRRHYVPNNATLVIVGDVDTDDAVRRADAAFGAIPPGELAARPRLVEPEQLGERRVILRKEGTTAYFKAAYHAPAVTEADFFPMLVLDAVLSGAKGMNLWSSFRTPPPQRSARLYQALVERGLASAVNGALLPTQHPFLYVISVTVNDGASLADVESATLQVLDEVRRQGIDAEELAKAKSQLRARLVFENDSVTNIAHQIGYFETIASVGLYHELPARVAGVTVDAVADVARRYLEAANRTIGWCEPSAAGGEVR